MLNRRRSLLILTAASLLPITHLVRPALAQAADAGASAFVKTVGDKLVAVVNGDGASDQKRSQITAIINATPRYTQPSEVMEAMKNGELSQAEGSRMLQRMKGNAGVITRPLAPPQ